jgi:hypothetical protein
MDTVSPDEPPKGGAPELAVSAAPDSASKSTTTNVPSGTARFLISASFVGHSQKHN